MYYNKVTLIGRLAKDPMVNEFAPDKKRGFFTLKVDRLEKDSRGKTKSDFISIICWNKLAEVAEEFLKKGNLILIDGQIQNRSYEKNGEPEWVTEIVAERIKFLNGKKVSK